MLPRFVHLWKDRLTTAVGQPAFWALENPGGGRPLALVGVFGRGKKKRGKRVSPGRGEIRGCSSGTPIIRVGYRNVVVSHGPGRSVVRNPGTAIAHGNLDKPQTKKALPPATPTRELLDPCPSAMTHTQAIVLCKTFSRQQDTSGKCLGKVGLREWITRHTKCGLPC